MERPPEILAKAEPRTLYVNRRLRDPQRFIKWARRQGFEKTLAPHELHVTIAFSRAPVDWERCGEDLPTIKAIGGERRVERLGDKGAVVLLFQCRALQNRHSRIRKAGASWDYDGYRPHITITYHGSGVDLAKAKPYWPDLHFGPERFEEVQEDWATNISEVNKSLMRVQMALAKARGK